MVEEKVRRCADFELGKWVPMGDRQHWMFPPPPAPGIDRDYDALIRVHREAEDADDCTESSLPLRFYCSRATTLPRQRNTKRSLTLGRTSRLDPRPKLPFLRSSATISRIAG